MLEEKVKTSTLKKYSICLLLRSEEHTSELQSQSNLVCRLLLEKKNKRAFNSVRPITAIHTLFIGQLVRAWAGPYRGTKLIDGPTWFPYQPTTCPTPPLPHLAA